MDFNRLYQMASTPRTNLTELGHKPWLIFWNTRKSWEDAMRHGTLVLQSVVQANLVLYEPGNEESAPACVLYTTHPAHAMDAPWLQNLTMRLRAIKEDPQPRDAEHQKIQELLQDEYRTFNITLPFSFTQGVKTTMQVVTLIPESLPGGHIPQHRLIPSIVGRDGNLWDIKPAAYA